MWIRMQVTFSLKCMFPGLLKKEKKKKPQGNFTLKKGK